MELGDQIKCNLLRVIGSTVIPQYLWGLVPGPWYVSCSDFVTPWTIASQALLSVEVSRQEYWSGLPFPSPGDLPNTGIKPRCPALQVDSLPSQQLGKFTPAPWQMQKCEHAQVFHVK